MTSIIGISICCQLKIGTNIRSFHSTPLGIGSLFKEYGFCILITKSSRILSTSLKSKNSMASEFCLSQAMSTSKPGWPCRKALLPKWRLFSNNTGHGAAGLGGAQLTQMGCRPPLGYFMGQLCEWP